DFTRFAGTMEFSGNNSLIRKNRIEAIAVTVKNFYKDLELFPAEKEAAVSGLRPVSPDGLPFIGRTSKYKNLIIGSGHAMMGWSLGPITGKLISQVIEEKETTVKLSPFDPDRFR
ncbi:MAG TPA: FAD-binding oxidoreductase, partial [Salinimicrobium sp.]|nr:FAD-binding oxidoreductase [Salinimicrobium sp.]